MQTIKQIQLVELRRLECSFSRVVWQSMKPLGGSSKLLAFVELIKARKVPRHINH